MRRSFMIGSLVLVAAIVAMSLRYPAILWAFLVLGPVIALGWWDVLQTRKAVKRNFPVIGQFRYLFELIRPEISQYFIESELNGVPFSREQRSVVYQRAKGVRDTVPFGTIRDVYEVGYEWVNHSLAPAHVDPKELRVLVGGPDCRQPYSASMFNISAMSYGSLSSAAVRALNEGARMGGFAHNTGEGGISPYHLAGGDLIWQIGTGYFGCRAADGRFDEACYRDCVAHEAVKMVELKLSQGAKPGHGGILPAAKVTTEISEIRGVAMGRDVLSPPAHSAFTTPTGLMEFMARLRELSGGKPVGFKLCVGKRREFLAIVKAMLETGITPDFISVDGGEGGTGAAPLEFSNHIGSPLVEGQVLVHNALVGFGLRDRVRVIASGKVTAGFQFIKRLALGADMVSSARGMMLALGCIQARTCNSNHCPVGVATQDPQLVKGLVVKRKSRRVANYHAETLEAVGEILGAMGLADPDELRPWHILRRVAPIEVRHYGEIFDWIDRGSLLEEPLPRGFERACRMASAASFASQSAGGAS